MNELDKFKKILEYFVKHMFYVCNEKDPKIQCPEIKFKDEDKSDGFVKSGHGYNEDGIQKQMETIADVKDNKFGDSIKTQKICISIDATGGFRKGSYLHLVSFDETKNDITNETAGTNINPIFKEEDGKESFISLQVGPSQNSPKYNFPPLEYTFEELGLGNNSPSSDQEYNLKTFFEYFIEMRRAELMGPLTHKGKEQLLATHNLILTGAPGTGKTWSAKNIASWMICCKSYEKLDNSEKLLFKEQCELVQFHPSYDYTDFVEGLRPIETNHTTNNSQQGGQSAQSSSSKEIGFELKNGVFKKFCEKALPEYNVVRKAAEIAAERSLNSAKEATEEAVKEAVKEAAEEDTKEAVKEAAKKAAEEATKEAAEEATKKAAKEATKKAAKEAAKKAAKGSLKDGEKATEEAPKDSLKDDEEAAKKAAEEWINSKASDIAKRVARKWAPKYVFIIDEINRGELSKIFGELFYSIDPGYRGVDGAVLTQYANMVSNPNKFDIAIYGEKAASFREHGHFFIPDNVYVIGTMNDIDRSVESMDFAMRRRFSFIEVKANEREDMWTEDWKDLAKKCMEAINEVIGIKTGLSSAYHIGPAYFKKLNDYEPKDYPDFFKLWDNHLYGVIFEYLRGKKDAGKIIAEIQDIYFEALIEAINKRLNLGGYWGEMLKNIYNKGLANKITDKDIKTFLNELQKTNNKIVNNSSENRTDYILKLQNRYKYIMYIGNTIIKLNKEIENENKKNSTVSSPDNSPTNVTPNSNE